MTLRMPKLSAMSEIQGGLGPGPRVHDPLTGTGAEKEKEEVGPPTHVAAASRSILGTKKWFLTSEQHLKNALIIL